MYSLEEFKAWLEEEPGRKENMSWDQIRNDEELEKLIKRINIPQVRHFADKSWNPFHQVALKWLAERERERERANSGGRG